MIVEYMYLMDNKKEFENMKYIIYVSKLKRNAVSTTEETNSIIKDFESTVF